MLRLAIELEGKRVEVRSLEDGLHTIGRSRNCEIKVNAPDISRAHLRLAVSGGQVMLENISQFGSKLDGVPVQGTALFMPGQKLTIGEMTTLLLEEGGADEAPAVGADRFAGVTVPEGATVVAGGKRDPSPARAARAETPGPAADDQTGEDIPRAPTGSQAGAADRTSAAATADEPRRTGMNAPVPEPDVPRTQGSVDSGTEAGHTRAMQTRMVSPEELEQLRSIEQGRVRRRLTLGLVIGIPLLILTILLWPRALPPELILEWPKDEQGTFIDAFAPAPGGGFADGGYDLMFPGVGRHEVKPVSGGLQVDLFVGRDLNVPLRIILQETREPRFAGLTREQTINGWIEEARQSGGTWNRDRPYSTTVFVGREQGIPMLRVSYKRQDDGAWFGMANVMRHGARRIVLRAEVPASEAARGEWMVIKNFMRPSPRFERTHWEGDGAAARIPMADLLRDARRELARLAPATWMEIEAMLRSALTQAALAGDAAGEREALELLQELRITEAAWFNSQQFALDKAEAQGDGARAGQIREFAKAVFSSMDDQRYYAVRKW